MEIHIGHLIKEVFGRQGRRATWLAAELNCNRSNVYSIFQRDNIDVEMLIKISQALDHNFLRDIAPWADYPKSLDNLPKNSIQDVQNLDTEIFGDNIPSALTLQCQKQILKKIIRRKCNLSSKFDTKWQKE